MPIRVKCEKCKKTLSVKDHLAGKKIKCPVCQSVVAVPLASPTKESPAAPPAAKPAAPTAAKKPVVASKPVLKAKPKPDSNGHAPPSNGEKTNGKAEKPIEPPPENVEAEALSALADEPPPPEETQTPKTIDFKCQWCDEEVKLPIEMAGKQAQCPNPDCKRIVKVPLPKTPEKKDWRKMERAGPAAAKINLPEALDNAWGTEEATRARQDSLAQAGAVELPPKPPLGVFGWAQRGFIAVGVVALLAVVGFGSMKLFKSHEQHSAGDEIKRLLTGREAISEPVLKAEAERTKGLCLLHGSNPQAKPASNAFQAALSYIDMKLRESPASPENPMLNEQFFLIDLALSQIETGGSGDDVIPKGRSKRQEWEKTREELVSTMNQIQSPEIQVIALREIATRLGQRQRAIGLAGGLSAEVNGKRPRAFRQQIALVYWNDEKKPPDDKQLGGIANEKDLDVEELEDGHLRVGFAEGYARLARFDDAFKLANLKGPEEDKLDAFLGIAAVALDKHKDKSAEALKAAVDIAKEPKNVSPWQWLEVARLGARLDDKDTVKQAIDRLSDPKDAPFKLRAQLEVFLALCDRSTTPVSTDALSDLAAEDKEGVTLALAWMALARQHAKAGASRTANLKTFETYKQTSSADLKFDLMQPMVVIGTYQRVK